MKSISIVSTVKKYPDHPYEAMVRKVLGNNHEISLVFVGPQRAASLNRLYRAKTYTPNVLSFPLSDHQGEIFICPQVAKREAAKYHLSPTGYVAFLFIHGLLHLKGHDHGDTMDKQERKYLKMFNVT